MISSDFTQCDFVSFSFPVWLFSCSSLSFLVWLSRQSDFSAQILCQTFLPSLTLAYAQILFKACWKWTPLSASPLRSPFYQFYSHVWQSGNTERLSLTCGLTVTLSLIKPDSEDIVTPRLSGSAYCLYFCIHVALFIIMFFSVTLSFMYIFNILSCIHSFIYS
jgi:hypothetical protein